MKKTFYVAAFIAAIAFAGASYSTAMAEEELVNPTETGVYEEMPSDEATMEEEQTPDVEAPAEEETTTEAPTEEDYSVETEEAPAE